MHELKTVTFDASQWQLVPRSPTLDMYASAMCYEATQAPEDDPQRVADLLADWNLMLAAAPTPAAQSAGQEAVAWRYRESKEEKWGFTRHHPRNFVRMPKFVEPLYAAPVNGGDKDRLLAALERAAMAESALRALADECDNSNAIGWEDRMRTCIDRANVVLSRVNVAPVNGGEHRTRIADFLDAWTRRRGNDPEVIHGLDGTHELRVSDLRALLSVGAPVNGGERDLAQAIHYPECWDTAAYPTLPSALNEVYASFKCTNDECGERETVEVAVALEQQRTLAIVKAVRDQHFGTLNSDIPTQASAAFDLACEEIEHRLRTEQWALDGVAAPLPVSERAADVTVNGGERAPCKYAPEGRFCERAADAPQVGGDPAEPKDDSDREYGEPIGYLPAYELTRLHSGHDANLRSAKFGPSALDGDIPVYLHAIVSSAKVPDAVLRALDRMSTPLHDSRLSGLTAELDAANIKTIRDYVFSGVSPAKVGGDEREAFEKNFCWFNPLVVNWSKHRDTGDYVIPVTQYAWLGWQARAALSADGGDRKDARGDVLSMHRDFEEWAETKNFNESDGPYATSEANAAWAAWRECMDVRGTPDAHVIEVRLPQGGEAIVETRTQVQMLRPLPAGTKLYAAMVRENQEIAE